MRVLIITVVHVPNDARIFRRQIGSLLAAGHQVTYAAPWTTTSTDPPDRNGLSIVDLPRSVGRHRLKPLRAARGTLNELGPSHDVVILHDPELMLAVIGHRRRLPPIVLDVHEDTASALIDRPWVPRLVRPFASWSVKRTEAWAERRATLLLAERSYQRRFKQQHLFVPNLPPLPPSDPPGPGSDRVVYVGRLARSRGALEMLEIAHRLPPDIELHLIGPADRDVYEAVADASTRGLVRWEGFVPNDDALRSIEGAMVGLSLIEPQPNHAGSLQTKVLEYLSRRVPVVTTDLPVTGTFVREHCIGIVVPHGDTEAALDAILHLQRDPRSRAEMSECGFRLVLNGYSWDAHEQSFVSAIEAVADGRSART